MDYRAVKALTISHIHPLDKQQTLAKKIYTDQSLIVKKVATHAFTRVEKEDPIRASRIC